MARQWRATAITIAAIASACGRGAGVPAQLRDECRALGADDALRGAGVELRTGATVTADGAIAGGTVPRCDADAVATRLFVDAADAMRRAPAGDAGAVAVVLLDPRLPAGATPVDAIQTHRASGALLVARAGAERIDATVWLHELAHARSHRAPLPPGALASRLVIAVEEGAADFFSATVAGTPRLGVAAGGGPARDLSSASRTRSGDWESLAVAGMSFDAQRMGRGFAAALWRESGGAGDLGLARAVLRCSERARIGDAATPRAVLDAWLAGCPPDRRDAIERALRAWVPAALYPAPTH